MKAYQRLSLRVHPDRVKQEEVEHATKKFQVLSKAYLILSDDSKRLLYDDSGCVDEEDETIQDRDWNEYWRLLFKRVTTEDITSFEKKYKKSEEESEDLKSAYIEYEGDMDKILEEIMCATVDDEPRFRSMIAQWIDEGSVPSFLAFTGETERKRKKRQRKLKNEEKESEELRKELGIAEGNSGLTSLIKARQATREKELNTFFDKLEEKYETKSKKSKISDRTKKGKQGKRKGTT